MWYNCELAQHCDFLKLDQSGCQKLQKMMVFSDVFSTFCHIVHTSEHDTHEFN